MDGILNICKPAGLTSHDLLEQVRKISGIRKSGHAGTLDPFASGVMIVLSGEARKASRLFIGLDKEYRALICLGALSDTLDSTGRIEPTNALQPTESKISQVVKSFKGDYRHLVPDYSAKKIDGKKFYEIKREGGTPPQRIQESEIYEIEIEKIDYPLLEIRVRCSSGTYIRALATDIGGNLSTGAYLKELSRISVGSFYLKNSVIPEDYKKGYTPLGEALKSFPNITLNSSAASRLKHGIGFSENDILEKNGNISTGVFPAYSEGGELIALVEKENDNFRARRVFNL